MEDQDKVIIPVHKQLLKSERKERKQKILKVIYTVVTCFYLFISGLLFGLYGNKLLNPKYEITASDTLGQLEYYFDKLWLYGDEYEDLKGTLEDNAFYGMTTYSEDPYTTYMSAEELDSFSTSINMNYVGIGVQYSSYDSKNTIDKVFKNSPAESAGLLAGDIILEVDGVDISNLSTSEIKALVVGESGTIVNVKVDRLGEQISFDVTRGAVDSSIYASVNDDYVLLELNSFGVDTADNIMMYLNEYRDYKKIIIDLRDNSGGYQSAVQEIAGLFIGNNKIYMLQEDKNGNQYSDYTKCSTTYNNFEEYVVLVNNNTASAAEVFAICLKEQLPNVSIVGLTTYGKGVVQTTYQLSNGAALKLTTSKWLSPSGKWINKEGIEPDYEVYLDDILYKTYKSMPKDVTNEYDDVSDYIEASELALRFLGYDVKRVDGYFDESFGQNLNAFKLKHGLNDDQILDSETYTLLLTSVTYEWASNPLKDAQMQKAIELLKD